MARPSVTLSTRVDTQLADGFTALCEHQGHSVSAMLRRLMLLYVLSGSDTGPEHQEAADG
jgi:hypothetical protein